MALIALQVDDPSGWNYKGDTTYMLALEAQKRGHSLFYYMPEELSWVDGRVLAPLRAVRFEESGEPRFTAEAPVLSDLATMDVVMLRQDPPYDMAYLSTTYLLERLPQSTLVLNDPKAVRDAPEKLWLMRYQEFMPPTLITRSLEQVQTFAEEHQSIILKPLYGYGGRSVFKAAAGDGNIAALVELWCEASRDPFMVQAFLPEVARQDMRVLLINGKVEGVTGRIPAAGEVRANFRVGGSAAAVELNAKQHAICDAIGPALAEAGIYFAGIDLIGDYLTEVNVTSPTGFRAVYDLYGINAAVAFWDGVETILASRAQ